MVEGFSRLVSHGDGTELRKGGSLELLKQDLDRYIGNHKQ